MDRNYRQHETGSAALTPPSWYPSSARQIETGRPEVAAGVAPVEADEPAGNFSAPGVKHLHCLDRIVDFTADPEIRGVQVLVPRRVRHSRRNTACHRLHGDEVRAAFDAVREDPAIHFAKHLRHHWV